MRHFSVFFFSSRRRHTRCALVTGVQTCALPFYALLLDDPELGSGLAELIRVGHYAAEYALKLQRDRLAAVFASMDDPYFQSRREEIRIVHADRKSTRLNSSH